MKIIALLVVFLTVITGGCVSGPPAPAPGSPSAPDPVPPADPDPVEQMPVGFIDLDTAIREASNYLNDNVPQGSTIVILNIQSVSEVLSEYVIDELIANAVNDRVFTAVDRQQLDLIRAENNLQLSGSVDDKHAVPIGRNFGAQTIVSGRVRKLGGHYRMAIRALDVETTQVQGQYNRNNITGKKINELMIYSVGGKEIKNSLAAVKAANEGDYITLKSGARYVLTYDEIDIARGDFDFNDLSGVPAQAGADGTEIKNISEAHTVKVYPDNRSAHLLKTGISFTQFMKYVERNLVPGRYIDSSGNSHDFEPVRYTLFPVFRATVQSQKISDGVSEYERSIITAYNYKGSSFTRRYYPFGGWEWGYVSGTFFPVGEPLQQEFDDE